MKKKEFLLDFVLLAGILFLGLSTAIGQCTDSMIVCDVSGVPGDTGIVVPVYGKVCGWSDGSVLQDLDGVTFGLEYDSSLINCTRIQYYGVTDPNYSSFYDLISNPSMFLPYIGFSDSTGYITCGVVFDIMGQNDIPPGYYRMFDLIFDVKAGATAGQTVLDIKDGLGAPPLNNLFTYVATDIHPTLIDGNFSILQESYGAIAGVITNGATSMRINNATVNVNGFEKPTQYDGYYYIGSLDKGYYNVGASAPNCLPDTAKQVFVQGGDTTIVNFGLTCLDSLWLPDSSCFGRWPTRIVPVYGKFTGWLTPQGHQEDLDGLVFAVQFDQAFLHADSIIYNITDSIFSCLHDIIPSPWMLSPHINNESGYLTLGIIFDMLGQKDVPPGRYHLFDLVFHVVTPETVWTPLSIRDGMGTPPLDNTFTYKTTDVYPVYPSTSWIFTPVEEIKDGEHLLPITYLLLQNYPNPFNSKTEVRYALSKESLVRLEIFNIFGQKVITLVDERQEAGYYNTLWNGVDWKGESVSSGVYFYRIEVEGYNATKKMVLLK